MQRRQLRLHLAQPRLELPPLAVLVPRQAQHLRLERRLLPPQRLRLRPLRQRGLQLAQPPFELLPLALLLARLRRQLLLELAPARLLPLARPLELLLRALLGTAHLRLERAPLLRRRAPPLIAVVFVSVVVRRPAAAVRALLHLTLPLRQ